MPSSSERPERQPREMDTPGPSKGPSRRSQPTAVFEIEEDRNRSRKITRLCGSDPLLVGTLVAVVVGMVAGLTIKAAAGSVSSTALELIGLPGEVMLRLLKMLVLPLVAGSMIAGIAAMRGSSASQFSRVAKWTVGAYAGTTAVAVLLGVVLVTTIRPGRGSALANMSSTDCHQQAHATIQHHAAEEDTKSPVDALLGVVRSAVPDNLAKAAVDTNVLGVITFSLLLGAALASLSPQAEPVLAGVDVFNAAIGKVVGWVVATSPIGIASLIAASILRTCDLAATLEALGLFVLTVLLALLIQAAIVLPAFLYAFARKAPFPVIKAFSQALLTAFGTSSSSAALPVNMACAEHYGIQPDIIRFVLPLGSTINMNGSALYEAVAVIFLAQANGEQLSIPQLLVVAFTATLAAVGSAPIPSAGLVTMLIVLQAVGLDEYADDLAVLLALDWLLDRCRTTVNVLGDAFTVVVVESQSQQPSRIARRGYAAVEAQEEAMASRTDEDGFDRPAAADANGHPPPL